MKKGVDLKHTENQREKGDFSCIIKKKIATLLVIGMAAMFMMNGCQKKASETETTKQTTAQSESTAQTEAATTYTSESNSFSFDLPDSAWVATKEGIENKWAFMKEGVGTIRITHKKSKIKEKNLPQSQEDAIALLNDIQENAFSQVEYKKTAPMVQSFIIMLHPRRTQILVTFI